MKRRVVVTGIGILCTLGKDKTEVLNSLKKGDSGLKKSNICKPYKELEDIKVGECDFDSLEVENHNTLERVEHMMRKALDEALCDSGLTIDELEKKGSRVSLSLSTSLAGTEYILKSIKEEEKQGLWLLHSREFISRMMKDYKIKGSSYTTSSACAAGTAGAGIGYDLVKSDDADIALVGGADNLTMFSLFGFNALKSLSGDICKPFDQSRDGTNLGEGSSFIILEELEHAKKRNARCYGEIVGYGLANDAYHVTSPDPEGEGAYFSMEMAIKEAGISPEDVDYINAHGTGTVANDIMEIQSIRRLFGDNPYVSSTKSRTGHCLGAAGSIEIGICLLALNSNLFLPTINSSVNIVEDWSPQIKKNSNKGIKTMASNSFAFAGNTASIIITSPDDLVY
ncbi:MAG: beta-ketoacyl-[acyl-carrier-protein] synthase family protein [Clostridia bacterium]